MGRPAPDGFPFRVQALAVGGPCVSHILPLLAWLSDLCSQHACTRSAIVTSVHCSPSDLVFFSCWLLRWSPQQSFMLHVPQ